VAVAIAVRVRFFARLREQAGVENEALQVTVGSTLADVYDAMRTRHPALEPDRVSVRAALNQEFVDWATNVSDGDEIAFIPPVSGGFADAL
jgi:molybdopterin converting factor subunit 1